ncbi:MAG: hypothetical protein K0R22_30 [Sporomusa sp.]|nr:hypothetical protein [Sporomusa sp.]
MDTANIFIGVVLVSEAVNFLMALLVEKPLPIQVVYDKAQSAGFSKRDIKQAKNEIGILSRQFKLTYDEEWNWLWYLPGR